MTPKSIKEIYAILEDEVNLKQHDHHDIERWFQLLEKQYKQKRSQNICRWEMYAWGFSLRDGQMKPYGEWPSKDGKGIHKYPDLDNFDPDGLNYLVARTEKVNSKYSKARYSHILWESKIKNRRFAETALENYMLLIDDENYSDKIDLSEICECIILLSSSITHRRDEVINLITNLITTGKLSGHDVTMIANFYLENIKTKSSKPFLLSLLAKCENIINSGRKHDLGYANACDAAIKISKKLQMKFTHFFERKAEYHLALADGRKDWIKQDFYFEALREYAKAGRKDKVEELAILIEESKDLIRLDSFTSEVKGKDVQDSIAFIQESADKAMTFTSYQIYEYIGATKEFLPRKQKAGKGKKDHFLDMCRSISYDINSNISVDSKKKEDDFFYRLYFSNFTAYHLDQLFSKGIISNKINFETLIMFLYERSWIGHKFYNKDYDGNDVEYCWVDLLAPSLFDYFKLANIIYKDDKNKYTGFVLCVDSLTLKMEGLIRHLAKIIKCPTIKMNKNQAGMREMYIEEILEHPRFKEYLSEEDIEFILFVLTKRGLNLRNNIAHCFYKWYNYGLPQIHILITLLLRLAKFEIRKPVTA